MSQVIDFNDNSFKTLSHKEYIARCEAITMLDLSIKDATKMLAEMQLLLDQLEAEIRRGA